MMDQSIKETREPVILVNEGQKLFGVFHRPSLEIFPAILICHGLAGHKTGRYRVYVELAEALAKVGIGALRLDFRGAGDSEGSFLDMTLTGQVSDALLALNWLVDHPQVDTKRIGIFGRSFGGSVAVITAAKAKICKSIALWAPIFSGDDWLQKWEKVKNEEGHPEELEAYRTINGQLGGLPFFEELFSMNLQPSLKELEQSPLLHIHGLKDVVVAPEHADFFKQHRKNPDVESKFMYLDESDHDFTHAKERREAIRETVEWFKSTL